ncbi:hypothetical protein B0T18DRAFT_313263 [Schizothecium vesticola]|uniref:Uncharacterized protein n=1 Tax=Schizothecium vesticola TaxID=314040 RepID=A0AA40KBV9_9PEZI|nr:hypothetical protein B0T18DRAFT_313263 [Schizothecium vesticola]
MNKCWFVLEQSFYTPPVYTTPSRAGGQTVNGNLRLGDVVPSPKNIYPVLTQGTLPRFGREMRITPTQLGEFKWDQTREREDSANAGAGAPIAVAAGITLSAEISAEFQRTMKTWANFKTLDIEVVQPSTTYIDEVIAQSNVQNYIEQHKTPPLDRWTIYVVIGLMIARAGGSIGSSGTKSHTFQGGTDLDIPGVANFKVGDTHKNITETHKSAQIQGDRVWAVRFAKVHKGLLRRKWMQTEEIAGAALDGDDEGEEQVQKVLEHEGLEKAKVTECPTALGATETWSFVTMAPDATHDA